MAYASVIEFEDLPKGKSVDSTSLPKPEVAVAVEGKAFSSNTQYGPWNSSTRFIRLHVDSDAYFTFASGGTPTAASGSASITAGTVEYFAVDPGGVLALSTKT